MTISRQILLRTENVLYKIVEKIKTHTHVMFNTYFPKTVPFEKMSKNFGGTRKAKNDNTELQRCMLGKYGYRRACTCTRPGTHTHPDTHTDTRARAHTRREICNMYCFSTATTVSQTRLSVPLYVHFLSCLK